MVGIHGISGRKLYMWGIVIFVELSDIGDVSNSSHFERAQRAAFGSIIVSDDTLLRKFSVCYDIRPWC